MGGGTTPTGTIYIDQNGQYDVKRYAVANVEVVPQGEITIRENGIHDVSEYGSAMVLVPIPWVGKFTVTNNSRSRVLMRHLSENSSGILVCIIDDILTGGYAKKFNCAETELVVFQSARPGCDITVVPDGTYANLFGVIDGTIPRYVVYVDAGASINIIDSV